MTCNHRMRHVARTSVWLQGMFVVSIGENSADPQFKEIAMVADSTTPSLHIYQLNVTFPK